MKDIASLFTPIERPATKDARHRSNRDKWLDATAKLINRPYVAVKLMTKGWPDWKIEQRYKEAVACSELTKPAIRWWSLRKRDKTVPNDEAKSA